MRPSSPMGLCLSLLACCTDTLGDKSYLTWLGLRMPRSETGPHGFGIVDPGSAGLLPEHGPLVGHLDPVDQLCAGRQVHRRMIFRVEAGRFHSGCHEHWQPSVPASPVLLLRKSRTAADSGGSGCIGRREPLRRATNGGVGVFSDRENQRDAFRGVGLAAAQVAPKCKRFAAVSPRVSRMDVGRASMLKLYP